MRRTIYISLFLLLGALVSASAQTRLPQSLGEFYSYGDNYFFEVLTLPGTVTGKARTVVNFRLTYDLLNFRRSSQGYRKEEGLYAATPTFLVEAVGSDGVIGDRGVWRDTVRILDYAQTNSKSLLIGGSIELNLRPGVYAMRYTYGDGTPGGGFTETTQPFNVDDFNSPSPAIGSPIFVGSFSGDTLVPLSVDGNALFGRRLRAYLPLASPDAPTQLRFDIFNAPRSGRPNSGPLLSGFGRLLGGVSLSRARAVGNDLQMLVRHRDRDPEVPARAYAAYIDASTDALPIGDYLMLLTYEAGGKTAIDSVLFQLRWVDMPMTLSRVDYAIKVLYPIATDDTIDALLSGDKEEQREALYDYWSRRDPTPKTLYNEAMAEYYRRADYALFNFNSIGQKDGAFTDRGKIYMLYGTPTDVSRDLGPEGPPREVWIYRNSVGRRFIFADDGRTGDYRLVEYHNL